MRRQSLSAESKIYLQEPHQTHCAIYSSLKRYWKARELLTAQYLGIVMSRISCFITKTKADYGMVCINDE